MMDQPVSALFPIVGLSILVGIASIYFIYKERRESRTRSKDGES